MKYKILKTAYLNQLENEVNSYLQKAWTLQGGVSAIDGYFMQAVVQDGYETLQECLEDKKSKGLPLLTSQEPKKT